MLVIGFIANWLVKPVADKYYMTDAELDEVRKAAHEKSATANAGNASANGQVQVASHPILVVIAWALVLIPISYGVWSTLQKAWGLFQ